MEMVIAGTVSSLFILTIGLVVRTSGSSTQIDICRADMELLNLAWSREQFRDVHVRDQKRGEENMQFNRNLCCTDSHKKLIFALSISVKVVISVPTISLRNM